MFILFSQKHTTGHCLTFSHPFFIRLLQPHIDSISSRLKILENMQTISGDFNCTQLLGKISSSLLSYPPLSFIYWPFLSTTANVHLFIQMLQLLALHTAFRRHVSYHNLTVHSETMYYECATWSSCSTVSFLLQKVREKIGKMIKLKVALWSVLQVLIH